MMETRKRPASPDNIGPSPKKRIISASDWSKPISVAFQPTDDMDEDVAGDQLERFRKEAIFRRMRHYERLYEDATQRLKSLEDKVNSRDTAVAAVDACWNQLVRFVQSLLPNGLSQVPDSSLEIYNITYSLPLENDTEPQMSSQYYERLRESSLATQKLIAAFLQLVPNAAIPEIQDLRSQTAAFRADAAVHRSEARMLRSKLQDTVDELQITREKLVAAENRVERVRSETVVVLEAKLGKPLSVEVEKTKSEEKQANGSPIAQTNGVLHPELSTEDDSWKTLAEIRENKIEELSKEVSDLNQEVSRLKLELQNPSDGAVAETVQFKKLKLQLSDFRTTAEEAKEHVKQLEAEIADLKATRLEFKASLEGEMKTKMDEMKVTIQKLQSDGARLRGMRDALNNDNTILKSKDQKLAATVNGLKEANALHKERIVWLTKETHRLRAALAVEAADEDYYAFISGNKDETSSYVATLKAKLKDAETKAATLEKTVAELNAKHPDVARHVQSEAEARKLYAEAQERLEKYERVYGSSSGSNGAGPSDTRSLMDMLAEKEEALRSMKALKRQRDEETHGMPSAMDDLCKQIEDLIALKEKQGTDHATLEEKLSRAQLEKAKADSKYFSAMRLKDAAETERKNMDAALGKQVKRVEKLQESEHALKQQIQHLERLNVSNRHQLSERHQDLQRLEDDVQLAAMGQEGLNKRITELEKQLKERQELVDNRRQQVRKLEEENSKLKKDVSRAEYRAEHLAPRSGSPTDVSRQNDNLLKLLKCSTCTKDFRSHVLTKCMHTFCKSCIDARLTTRQRKCPACQMAFAQSDVQQIFFQ